MRGDLAGVILSVSLIALCWLLSYVVKNYDIFGKYTKETARKIVHIGVSNFAFIYLYVFDSDFIPALGLIAFACINLYIELHTGERRSWGTVLYPLVVAFIILVNSFIGQKDIFVASALLGMGYGDGLAAIAGMLFGKSKLPLSKNKTWAGSLTCFFVVSTVMIAVAKTSLLPALITGFVAAVFEAYTPFGLDNISVPLAIYICGVLLCC